MVQGIEIEDGCILNKNAAMGELISKVAVTMNVDDLVQQAQTALPKWSAVPVQECIDLLKQGLREMEKNSDEICRMIVQEMGNPLSEAQQEIEGAVNRGEYFDILFKTLQPSQHNSSTVVRQPLGVVVILIPWNFPADEILLLALPALASGNVVIVKPAEVAPETGRIVIQTLAQGLPSPHILQ